MSFLVDRGLLGLAWVDTNLCVTATSGRLAEWIEVGQHVCADLTPFHGMDDDVQELRDDFRPSLVLAKIGLNLDGDVVEKVSIEVFWVEAQETYVLVFHQLGAQPEFEAELARQMRARRLAEENLAKMQRNMQETQSLLDVIAERAPSGVAIFDPQQRYLFANRRWLELLGLETETVASRRHRELTSGATVDLEDALSRAGDGHVVDDDLRCVTPVGGDAAIWRALRHAPWRGSNGELKGVVSTADDASLAERRYRTALDRIADLERINGDLENFAALVAHDLRGPLKSAQQRLAKATATSVANIEVPGIDETFDRMSSILDGLLDYTATSGLPGPMHAVDVRALVARIVGEALKETLFTYEMGGTWPMLTTAVAPLDLVFRNLVQNAVKHHDLEAGHLQIACVEADDVWNFCICDDGPGISSADQDRVFLPLETVNHAGRSGVQGRSSGLGLAFVRRAAESVGGRVDVSSDPDNQRGTTFRVSWPKRH